jgi:hypothetical protein
LASSENSASTAHGGAPTGTATCATTPAFAAAWRRSGNYADIDLAPVRCQVDIGVIADRGDAVLREGAGHGPLPIRFRAGIGRPQGFEQADRAGIAEAVARRQVAARIGHRDHRRHELALLDRQATRHVEQGRHRARAQDRRAERAEHRMETRQLVDLRFLLPLQRDVAVDAAKAEHVAVLAEQRPGRALDQAHAALAVLPLQYPAAPAAALGDVAVEHRLDFRPRRRRDQVEDVASRQLRGAPAEQVLDAAVGVGEAAAEVHLPDPVLGRLDDGAEALLALAQRLLHLLALGLFGKLAQRILDGGGQAQQVVLEHVVRGAAAQRLERGFLADRARDEDEGPQRRQLAHQAQRVLAAEARHGVVAQHQVGVEGFQRDAQVALVVDPQRAHFARHAAQRPRQQLGIVRTVLDQQYAQGRMVFVFGHGTALTRSGW